MIQNVLNPFLTILFLVGFCCFTGRAQDSGKNVSSQDSVVTPFQKGRWLTGLSGGFSSNTLKISGTDDLVSANAYSLEISTGRFFKDRWFVGANVFASSSSGGGLVDRKTETLLIGPSMSYYFLKEPYGSLFVSLLPGYVRIRESGSFEGDGMRLDELVEGPGFATRLGLGYAYVISDRIVLNVSVGSTWAWANATYGSGNEQESRTESIFSNTSYFSFGFNILLDEFFF